MKNRFLLCLVGLIISSITLFASDNGNTNRRINLGVTGGLSQCSSLSGDVYGGVILPFNPNKTEINFGYTYFKNSTDYSGVKDLEFNSHGLFIEGNYYLIKGLYGGLKFAINFNWVDNQSQKKFEAYPDIDSPTFFPGIAGYGHVGYYLPMGDTFGIKLQGQIGLHNYKIAQGCLLIDNSSSDLRNVQHGIERHAELLYNLSIGLTFRL
jgi:hypothetical protein